MHGSFQTLEQLVGPDDVPPLASIHGRQLDTERVTLPSRPERRFRTSPAFGTYPSGGFWTFRMRKYGIR